MEIRHLSLVSQVTGGDNVPIYDGGSLRTRACTIDMISLYVAGNVKPVSGSVSNGNITLVFGDGSSFVISNVKTTGLGDMPQSLVAGQFLRVNALGTGYELVAQPAVGTQITVKNGAVQMGFADTISLTGNASFTGVSGTTATLNVNAVKVASGVAADDLLKFDSSNNQLIPTGVKVTSDGSVIAQPNSYYLGGAHSISSGGENVFFTNLFNAGTYIPTWQKVDITSSPLPTYRNYTDGGASDITLESSTADVLTNPSYVITATASRRLFSATVLPASNQTNVIFELICNGVVVWKRNVGTLTANANKVIVFSNFASPIDVSLGQVFTTNIYSADGAVTLRGSLANNRPYLVVSQRTWADVNIGDMWRSMYDPQNIAGDAFLRSNHTGTQAISTVANLQSSLDAKAAITYVDTQDSLKVDKVAGKGLSTNDYTTAEQTKLAGIAAGANMLKSVYDVNNDGIVDNSAKVNGVDVAGNRFYYGTNASGTPGFYALNFRSVSNIGSAGRPFNSVFTPSATRDTMVYYTINMAVSANSETVSNARVDIQVAGSTVESIETAISITATLGIATVNLTEKKIISAYVPAGATVQLVTSGTVTPTLLSGQEVTL